jgi:DNA-3-methyladenine glycosylase II
MDNDAIIEALVPVRGIGRWTVEMMLMFRLGRPDVLPVDDLGIRKGAQLVDRLETMPAPKALLERGERWGPYRTYASLYLWRIADSTIKPRTPAGSAPAKRSQD